MTDITDNINSVLAFCKNYKNDIVLERRNYCLKMSNLSALAICFPIKSQNRPKTALK